MSSPLAAIDAIGHLGDRIQEMIDAPESLRDLPLLPLGLNGLSVRFLGLG